MVIALPICDVLNAYLEINPEILHNRGLLRYALGEIYSNRFKIIQRFVTEKFILLMASLLHKWLLVGYMAVVHPFYVSVTEINHNAKDKTIEISCKTFFCSGTGCNKIVERTKIPSQLYG